MSTVSDWRLTEWRSSQERKEGAPDRPSRVLFVRSCHAHVYKSGTMAPDGERRTRSAGCAPSYPRPCLGP